MQSSNASPPTRGARGAETRSSLLERLADWDDRAHWQEFFDTYWRLIYSVARKAGLSDQEAQEVVQETVITVAKNITQYERQAGSFKSWLLHTTRWRIADQFRKRDPAAAARAVRRSDDETATIERIPAPGDGQVEAAWESEWKRNLFHTALERLKARIPARQYQIFECCAVKHWSASRVAAELRINIAQVYLTKHRVTALMKKEVAALQKQVEGPGAAARRGG